MTAPILALEKISKRFGAIVIADGIDLALGEGEALGILGPNGAGKTTLFGIISGTVQPDSGRVLYAGADITAMSPERRCAVGIGKSLGASESASGQAAGRYGIGRSFQIPQPFDHLSVFENLSVAALFGGGLSEAEAVQHCGRMLDLTGLEAKANRLAGSLPLLDRKRLELARALATKPRTLLLDEIAGGLTDAECHELVETIRTIHAEGVGIIWIEHVVHALLAVADRLLVIHFGRHLAQGKPAAVMDDPEVRRVYLGLEG